MQEKNLPTPEEVKRGLEEHIKKEAKKDPDYWKKLDENTEKKMPKGDEAEK